VSDATWFPTEIGVQLKVTVTVWFVQVPAVYGWPPAVALVVIPGAERTMSMPFTTVVVTFPATSVHVAVTDWLAPALVTVTESGFDPDDVVVAPDV
jgi:poly-beta-hydroxyalkanoate depolymerase